MVPHSSHTNHEFLILVIRVTYVNFTIESFEENCATYKILVGLANLLQIML